MDICNDLLGIDDIDRLAKDYNSKLLQCFPPYIFNFPVPSLEKRFISDLLTLLISCMLPLIEFTKFLLNCQHFYILAGELLSVAAPFLEQQMHPTVVISAFRQALEDLIEILQEKVR